MSDTCNSNCDLPNVDIFDPIKCVEAWQRCATDQQIHVYLNSEIKRTQQCLQAFVDAQKCVNTTLDCRTKESLKRIGEAEQEIAKLKVAQASLDKAFQDLNTSNNDFKLTTEETLKLYQKTIDALTASNVKLQASNEKLWLEFSKFKSELDMDKINQALAGYEQIMTETKALIEKSENETAIKLQQMQTQYDKLSSQLTSDLAKNDADNKAIIASFKNDVNNQITNQNNTLNTYIKNTDENISKFKADVKTHMEALNKRVDETNTRLDEVSGGLNAKLDNVKTELGESIVKESTQRKDADERIEGLMSANNTALRNDFDKLSNNVTHALLEQTKETTQALNDLDKSINKRIDVEVKDINIKHDADIKTLTEDVNKKYDTLDSKIDQSVSGLDKTVNDRITQVTSDLTAQIVEVDANAKSGISDVKTELEMSEKALQKNIDLVDESSRARDSELSTKIDNTLAVVDESLAGIAQSVVNNHDSVLNSLAEHEKIIAENAVIAKNDSEALSQRINKISESDQKQWTTINEVLEAQNLVGHRVDNVEKIVAGLGNGGEGGGSVPAEIKGLTIGRHAITSIGGSTSDDFMECVDIKQEDGSDIVTFTPKEGYQIAWLRTDPTSKTTDWKISTGALGVSGGYSEIHVFTTARSGANSDDIVDIRLLAGNNKNYRIIGTRLVNPQ